MPFGKPPKACKAPSGPTKTGTRVTMASTDVMRIPKRIAPFTLRYNNTAVMIRPMIASHAVGAVSEPRPIRVASLATTIPALRNPKKARKAPMPAVIANLSPSGMARTIACRAPITLKITNRAPEMKTAPSAVCHG